MEVQIKEGKPLLTTSILTRSGIEPRQFLIDTGCTMSLVFTAMDNTCLREFSFTGIEALDPNEWIQVADGRKVSTFKATAFLNISGQLEEVESLIIEGKPDFPIIGMEFLEQNRKRLVLDFAEHDFQLI